jgi:hypothetical protein
MNIPDHISFRELRFKFLDADADPGIFLTLDPGWKKLRSGMQDNHPGSATLIKGKI